MRHIFYLVFLLIAVPLNSVTPEVKIHFHVVYKGIVKPSNINLKFLAVNFTGFFFLSFFYLKKKEKSSNNRGCVFKGPQ